MKIFTYLLVGFLASCSGSFDKQPREPVERESDSGSERDDGPSEISADRRTFVQSFSNSPITGFNINRSKANEEYGSLERSGKGSKNVVLLSNIISAIRLAARGFNESLSVSKQVLEQEQKKGAERQLPEMIALDLALDAMQGGRIAMSEHLFDRLVKSKNPKIRASVFTAQGVLALKEGRIPEAALLFREALKVSPDYKAAELDLGFLALSGGDFGTAKRVMPSSKDFASTYGQMVLARLGGDGEQASQLCERLIQRKKGYKVVLLSCALNEFQVRHNLQKAKSYVEQIQKSQESVSIVDEKASVLMARIVDEDSKEQAKKVLGPPKGRH